MKDVFVIGDVHGHADRLEALLVKAGVDERDCTVVQLGDLGHYGPETRHGDREAWKIAYDGRIDIVLWGNHDRAVVARHHTFVGFAEPEPEVSEIMARMENEGRLKMAYAAHGWLITHAGVHKQFKHERVSFDKTDPEAIADWLSESYQRSGGLLPLVENISRTRAGAEPYGGILWRDIAEKLYGGVRQVFGHSASLARTVRGSEGEWWCIDIGGKGGPADPAADCLAGIWLPSEEIVRVDLGKEAA